jgi:hypothetical protein
MVKRSFKRSDRKRSDRKRSDRKRSDRKRSDRKIKYKIEFNYTFSINNI